MDGGEDHGEFLTPDQRGALAKLTQMMATELGKFTRLHALTPRKQVLHRLNRLHLALEGIEFQKAHLEYALQQDEEAYQELSRSGTKAPKVGLEGHLEA